MRTKICNRCKSPFAAIGEDNYLCPTCSTEYFKSAPIQNRTCRQCGAVFSGGPRAWYCPECRAERKKESKSRYQKNGASRKLGSVDKCENCCADYVVNSARQRYCKACAETVVADHIRQRSREYNAENKDRLNNQKQESRHNRNVCIICGTVYDSTSPSVTCSPECAKKLKKLRQDEKDIRRGKRKMPAGVYFDSGKPKSGVVGVTASKSKKWCSQYKNKYLGTYDTIQEASAAIEKYKKENQNDK